MNLMNIYFLVISYLIAANLKKNFFIESIKLGNIILTLIFSSRKNLGKITFLCFLGLKMAFTLRRSSHLARRNFPAGSLTTVRRF